MVFGRQIIKEVIMFIINSSFIGDFKTGDNIIYNLETICKLYESKKKEEVSHPCVYNKPIVVILGSIVEAIIYDLYFKAKNFNIEGVKELSSVDINSIKKNKKNEFSNLIRLAKKIELFKHDKNDPDIYISLYFLRDLRNRIHIQNSDKYNSNKDPEGDSRYINPISLKEKESEVFTDDILEKIEILVERIFKYFEKFVRFNGQSYVEPFSFPWNEH